MAFDFDVIIIGSGFGGSVAAKRFTQAGRRVAILEMGERFHSGGAAIAGKLKQSQDTKYIYRVMRDYPDDYVTSDTKLVVAQGMGYGGGSLTYSGIHLRAPTSAFATGWPSGYTRTNLDPYYARAEANLGVAPDPNTFKYKRPSLFKKGAALAGVGTAQALPLNMTGCVHCGWCVPTCIYDKKGSMPLNYLKAAELTGRLSVYTGYKGTDIEPLTGGGYRVWILKTSLRPDRYHLQDENAYWDGTWYALSAPKIVVAAGAMESPAILQRSNYWWGLSFPTTNLGKGIDGQGDAITGGFVPASTPTDTYKGAIMMSQVDRGDWVLQEIHGIPAGPTVKYPVTLASIGQATFGLDYKRKLKQYGAQMLGIATIGKSPSGGNISVDDTDSTYITKVSTTAYQPPTGALAAAASIITALGGEVAKTPWDMSGMIATVHPTGGCRMGASSTDGSVVNKRDLSVWGNTGIHVIDGSVIPSNTFRNPSNTILAIAEKAMDVILGTGDPGW
jgi:cholesterol oxidase